MNTKLKSKFIIGVCFCFSTLLRAETPPPPADGKPAKTSDKAAKRSLPFNNNHKPGEQHSPGEYFKHMDTDGDGKVSKEEFMKAAEERFAKFDGNKDGVLEKEDVPTKVKERLAQKKPQGKHEATAGKGITKEEFLKHNADRFDAMDKNKDGFIDKSEIEESMKKMHEHVGHPAPTGPRVRPK